ncbi:MAG TPA: sigma-70 family RNA polymerase sigma factor [Dongiaceae bacterium]|nr:sigma-70 family RNA polymerase sigma factor [Dongiaceae bacterium]
MPELSDHELLTQYAQHRSESAFAALVQRHIHLVHSVAWRCTGNPHAAEEITQAVFVILARKAGRLRREVVLSGWLYHTARLTAANYTRAEHHRAQREQEAHMQATLEEPATAMAWDQIAPLLEEAMGHLGRQDRDAVVLRYFENKTAPEIAVALNLNEEAAQKRVRRAVEKLRKFFLKRGVTLPTTVIAGAVSAHSVTAAPAGLAATVAATTAASATLSASITTLVKGTLKFMAYTKLKWMAVAGIAVLLAGSTTTVVWNSHRHSRKAANGTWVVGQRVVMIQSLLVKAPAADAAALNQILTGPGEALNPKNAKVLEYLKSHPDVSILSAPRITTGDGVGAAVDVTDSTNAGAGISLEVTPKIQPAGNMALSLRVELREATGKPTAIQTSQMTIPQFTVLAGVTTLFSMHIENSDTATADAADTLLVFLNVSPARLAGVVKVGDAPH